MARIYKGVEGYDVEYEYLVMQDRIAEESEKNVANKQVRWRDIVKGTDLVSLQLTGSVIGVYGC